MEKQTLLNLIERVSKNISEATILPEYNWPDVLKTPKYLVEYHPQAFVLQIYLKKGPVLTTYARISTNISSEEALEKLLTIILND